MSTEFFHFLIHHIFWKTCLHKKKKLFKPQTYFLIPQSERGKNIVRWISDRPGQSTVVQDVNSSRLKIQARCGSRIPKDINFRNFSILVLIIASCGGSYENTHITTVNNGKQDFQSQSDVCKCTIPDRKFQDQSAAVSQHHSVRLKFQLTVLDKMSGTLFYIGTRLIIINHHQRLAKQEDVLIPHTRLLIERNRLVEGTFKHTSHYQTNS